MQWANQSNFFVLFKSVNAEEFWVLIGSVGFKTKVYLFIKTKVYLLPHFNQILSPL